MSPSPEVGELSRPEVKETRSKPVPPIAELLAVANAKPAAGTTADEFIKEHDIQSLLGRVLDSRELRNPDRFDAEYRTPSSAVNVHLEYEWTYNLSSKEAGGDNEGMSFVIMGDQSIGIDGQSLEYQYSVIMPEDDRLISEAGHSWKVVDERGVPTDGFEFKPEQIEASGDENDELVIALLQRGCEDLAHAFQA